MSLRVGAKLPHFSSGELDFIRGEPTDLPVAGHPTIIELWATWCGPCRQMFPHLSNIAAKHAAAELKVVGISLDDGGATPQLRSFVQSQNMTYTVAAAKVGCRNVGAELMTAAGVSGIPHAFVCDRDGVLQFSGHPAKPEFTAIIQKLCSVPAPSAKVTKSREELSGLPVRELKMMLQQRGVSMLGASEKRELVDLVLQRCC